MGTDTTQYNLYIGDTMVCTQSFYRNTYYGEYYTIRHKLLYNQLTEQIKVGIEIPNARLDALPDIIKEAPAHFKVATVNPVPNGNYSDGSHPDIFNTVIEFVFCDSEGNPYRYGSLGYASNIVKDDRTYHMDGSWDSRISEFTELLWKFMDDLDYILANHTDYGDACY